MNDRGVHRVYISPTQWRCILDAVYMLNASIPAGNHDHKIMVGQLYILLAREAQKHKRFVLEVERDEVGT